MSLKIRRRRGVPTPYIVVVGKGMGFLKNNTAQVMCQNPVCYLPSTKRKLELGSFEIACKIVRVCVTYTQVKSVESNNVF
jgi:hypothetical protein